MWMMLHAANEALAKVASFGIGPNMTLYLMGNYRLHIATATRILLLSSAAGNFTPLVGAIIGDSYLGKFLTVGFGSIFTFLVFYILLPFLIFFLLLRNKIKFFINLLTKDILKDLNTTISIYSNNFNKSIFYFESV